MSQIQIPKGLALNPNDKYVTTIGCWHIIKDSQGKYFAVYIHPHNGHNYDLPIESGQCDKWIEHLYTETRLTESQPEITKDLIDVYEWHYENVNSEVF